MTPRVGHGERLCWGSFTSFESLPCLACRLRRALHIAIIAAPTARRSGAQKMLVRATRMSDAATRARAAAAPTIHDAVRELAAPRRKVGTDMGAGILLDASKGRAYVRLPPIPSARAYQATRTREVVRAALALTTILP
jgi:hypothetical protein